MKALGIGEVMLDKITLLDSYPKEGTKITPRKIETSVGGSAISAMVMLSRLGVDCTIIVGIGDDENGQIIRKKLKNEKINIIPRVQKHSKVHTVLVSYENGSRTVIKDNIKSTQIENISDEIIKNQDIVLFDRHVYEAFNEVINKKEESTKTLIDTSIEVSQKTMFMLEHADFPIIPIEFIEKIQGKNSILDVIEGISNLTKKTFIITLGGHGVLICDKNQIRHVEPYDIKVVDTLGAGDVFRGSFAYGILKGWDLEDAVKFGNLSAALQCTKLGSVSAIPTKEEIYDYRKVARKRKVDISHLGIEVISKDLDYNYILDNQEHKEINFSEYIQ